MNNEELEKLVLDGYTQAIKGYAIKREITDKNNNKYVEYTIHYGVVKGYIKQISDNFDIREDEDIDEMIDYTIERLLDHMKEKGYKHFRIENDNYLRKTEKL